MPQAQDPPLQIDEDRLFQSRFWTLQRIAWLLMTLVVALGLAGLTGAGGPLSRGSLATPQGRVEYPRVARWASEDEFLVSLHGAGPAAVEIDRRFFEIFAVERIQPVPRSTAFSDLGQRLVFDRVEGAGPLRISIRARAQHPALLTTRFRLAEGQPAELSLVVLP